MNSSNLKTLLTEYEKKRLQAIYDAENRKAELYKKEPKLQQIDDELNKTAINISKKMIICKDSSLLEELNKKVLTLKHEKEKILSSLEKDENYLKPYYECSNCNDTGYIKNELCSCVKQRLLDEEYNSSNIYNLKNQTFENFKSTVYNDKVENSKYKLSPRENIKNILEIAHSFIDNFNDNDTKNLLFNQLFR